MQCTLKVCSLCAPAEVFLTLSYSHCKKELPAHSANPARSRLSVFLRFLTLSNTQCKKEPISLNKDEQHAAINSV